MGARRWSGWTRGGPTRPSRRPAGASSARWITTSWPASWPGTAATWPTPAAPSGTSTSSTTGPWTGATSGEPWPPTPCPTSTAGPPGSAPAAPRTRTPTPPRAPGPGSDPPTAPTIPLINTKEPTQQRRFQKTLPVPAQWNKHPRNPARDGIKHRWFIRFKNTISLFFGSVGCVKRGRCRVCKGKEKRTYH